MNPPEDQKNVIESFKEGPAILESALAGLNDSELDYAPSNGGWTIRQIVHHLADGDDLWKISIKIALGNDGADFSLKWYSMFPQTEWAKHWSYEKRPIDTSLALLKASRDHIVQLLKHTDNGWSKSVQFKTPDDKVELIPVGFVVQMQAEHIVHHVKHISAIRKEISGT